MNGGKQNMGICHKHRIITTDDRTCFMCEDEPHFKGKPLEKALLISEVTEFEILKANRPEMFELLLQMVATSNAKGHDYGGQDTYSNLRVSDELGVPAWKGVLIRMLDKVSRIKNFARQDTLLVKDESLVDTLMDLSVYSLLCVLMYREYKDKENAD